MSHKYKEVYRYLNPLQRWLYNRGGRTMNDIEASEFGPFVWMWDGYEKKKMQVFIPSHFLEQSGTQFI